MLGSASEVWPDKNDFIENMHEDLKNGKMVTEKNQNKEN